MARQDFQSLALRVRRILQPPGDWPLVAASTTDRPQWLYASPMSGPADYAPSLPLSLARSALPQGNRRDTENAYRFQHQMSKPDIGQAVPPVERRKNFSR